MLTPENSALGVNVGDTLSDTDMHDVGAEHQALCVCTISAKAAVLIYQVKKQHAWRRGEKVAWCLGQRFGITPKAVRDIWTLRTWARATRPHWTPEDRSKFLKKKLCVPCLRNSVSSFEQACVLCKVLVPGLVSASPTAESQSSTVTMERSGLSSPESPPAERKSELAAGDKGEPGGGDTSPANPSVETSSRIYTNSSLPTRLRPTNHDEEAYHELKWHNVSHLPVEVNEHRECQEQHDAQESSAQSHIDRDGGLEWLVPTEEIAQEFNDILISWGRRVALELYEQI